MNQNDMVALIDLDSTVANYDEALKAQMESLQSPNEPAYGDRYTGGVEPDYIAARRKLVQKVPGFWRNLKVIEAGMSVVSELRSAGFGLHVLTKGPQSNSIAWGEKLEWSREWIPDAVVTVTGDKSLVYGRVLVDDFPPYFTGWLGSRPRGLVICVAHPWNADYAKGGSKEHPNVLRWSGQTPADLAELRDRIALARERSSGSPAR